MSKKITNDQWLSRARAVDPDGEYTWLDEYAGTDTKIRYRHEKCGRVSSVRPSSFVYGARCHFCDIEKRTKTFEEWVAQASKLPNGEEYTWYKPNEFKRNRGILVLHSVCGCKTRIQPNHFSQGTRCHVCADIKNGINRRKTNEQWLKEAGEQEDGYQYKWLEPYVTGNTPIMAEHLVCHHTYRVRPSKFLGGRRCPKCANRLPHTNVWWLQKVSKLPQHEEYVWEEPYKSTNSKILVRHTVCNMEFKTSPSNFIRGSRCPFCNSSKGELLVRDFLDSNEIKYEAQKQFKNLRGSKKAMSFDFYLPNNHIAIEYNGIQHYEPVKFFGGSKKYHNQVEHDNKKATYCVEHSISLLVLPYWDTDEDTIAKLQRCCLNG